MERLKIKGVEDKLLVAKILIANGYTCNIVTVKEPGKKSISVLQYEENKQSVVEE